MAKKGLLSKDSLTPASLFKGNLVRSDVWPPRLRGRTPKQGMEQVIEATEWVTIF